MSKFSLVTLEGCWHETSLKRLRKCLVKMSLINAISKMTEPFSPKCKPGKPALEIIIVFVFLNSEHKNTIVVLTRFAHSLQSVAL